MKIMQPLSPGVDGITYANVPTCDGLKVLQWCICDVHIGHLDQILDRVRLPNRLQDAGEGPIKLQ